MPLLKNSGRGVSWFSVEGTSINDVRRFLRRFLRFFWPPSSPNLNLQQLDQPTLFWHFLKKITTTGWSANSQIKWTGLILMIHTTHIFVFFVPTSSLHWWFCDVWTKKKHDLGFIYLYTSHWHFEFLSDFLTAHDSRWSFFFPLWEEWTYYDFIIQMFHTFRLGQS